MEYKLFLSRISAIEKECLDDVVTILKQTGDVEFNNCDCPEVSYYDSYGKIETVGVKSISVVDNGIELELFNGKILDGFSLADNSICEVYSYVYQILK